MDAIMLPVHVQVAQLGQGPVNGAAQGDGHYLVLPAVDDVQRRLSEVFQERHQDVVQPGGHGYDGGEAPGMMRADQVRSDPAVGHAGEKHAVGIHMVAGLNRADGG